MSSYADGLFAGENMFEKSGHALGASLDTAR